MFYWERNKITRQEFEALRDSVARVNLKLDNLATRLGAKEFTQSTYFQLADSPGPLVPAVQKLHKDFALLLEHLKVTIFDYPATRQVRRTGK